MSIKLDPPSWFTSAISDSSRTHPSITSQVRARKSTPAPSTRKEAAYNFHSWSSSLTLKYLRNSGESHDLRIMARSKPSDKVDILLSERNNLVTLLQLVQERIPSIGVLLTLLLGGHAAFLLGTPFLRCCMWFVRACFSRALRAATSFLWAIRCS